MAHHISAIVTKATVVAKQLNHQKLPQGFVILLDTESNRKALNGQDYVSIWTDYFGGMGEQGCRLARAGQTDCICDKCGSVLVPRFEEMSTINEGLRALGVKRTDSDEFDAVNLGNFRDNEDIEDSYADACE